MTFYDEFGMALIYDNFESLGIKVNGSIDGL